MFNRGPVKKPEGKSQMTDQFKRVMAEKSARWNQRSSEEEAPVMLTEPSTTPLTEAEQLEKRAVPIRMQLHQAREGDTGNAAEHFVKAGESLRRAKRELTENQWLPFVKRVRIDEPYALQLMGGDVPASRKAPVMANGDRQREGKQVIQQAVPKDLEPEPLDEEPAREPEGLDEWVADLRDRAAQTAKCYANVAESLVALGRRLVEAKASLGETWDQLFERERLPFPKAYGYRLIAMAKHKSLPKLAAANSLPIAAETLYELSKWEPEELDAAVDAGVVSEVTTRAEARQHQPKPPKLVGGGKLAEAAKARRKPKQPDIVMEQVDHQPTNATPVGALEQFVEHLRRSPLVTQRSALQVVATRLGMGKLLWMDDEVG